MDLDKVRTGLEEIEAEKEQEEAQKQAEANKSFLDRAGDELHNAMDTLGALTGERAQQEKSFAEGMTNDTEAIASGVADTAEDIAQAAQDAQQKWQNFRQRGVELQQAYSPENVEQANDTGDYSNMDTAVQNAQEAGEEFTAASRNLALSPVRQAARSFIDTYADDDNGGILQEGAQALQRTDANLEYFMTDSEKLAKARQIEASTGIPAEAFIADNKAYKQALDVYNFKQKVDQAGGSIENVWNEFPELRDVADMDTEGAAIALHNLDEIRSTHGILETFTKMYERGSKQLEFNNLQYKIMMGRADDNDIERANQLKEELQQERQEAPSFFDNPVAAIVGGVAESLPEMGQSMLEGAHDAAEYASLAMIAGAMAGSAAGPLGTGGGALLGGVGGALTGFARSLAGQAARRQLIVNALRYGAQVGAFTGMAKPESGSRYDDLGELRDKDGNPLLTDNQRKAWALLGGAANAGIELANFGLITKVLSGAPHAKRVFGDILENTGARMTMREGILNSLKENAGDVLKITASEAGEEGLQSISDDMIHNGIEWSTGDTSNHIYSTGEIFERAAGSSLKAVPGSLGFGLMGAAGGMGSSFLRKNTAMRNLAKWEAQYGENARKTYIGTTMLEQLQQTVQSGKLKEQAPDVQKKILREELKDTDYQNVYIDTEMAMQKENGLDDLKAVAKAANISDEDLKTAIDEKGQIMVPTEQFSQAASSPELLQSVSFSPEADSMARMQHDAKSIIDDMKARQQKAIDKQIDLINTVLDEYFPTKGGAEKEDQKALRDMAAVAIYTNPANPARGWSAAMQERKARLQEILAPALKRLRDGMGKGGQLMEVEDEQGNKRTQRFTENDEWYRNFYKSFKRKPTEAELEDMAVAMTTGDASAPKIEGWIPTTEEEQQAMAAMKPEIDQLRTEIHQLEEIKGTMKSLNGVEMELTQGLSKEGFQVYRAIRDQLSNVDVDGGSTARAARMDAILFARHADIVADILTKKTGKKYTALDYMRERYGLKAGSEKVDGLKQQSFEQRAWHGSPYDFDVFDLGKIGSGEGAQVHGWGLYFAKDRKISDQYKETLSTEQGTFIKYKGHIYDVDGKDEDGHLSDSKALRTIASMMLWKKKDEVEAKIKQIKEKVKEGSSGWKLANECLELLHSDALDFVDSRKLKGKLFKVEVPDDAYLLEEDKIPYKNMPAPVQQGIRKAYEGLNEEQKRIVADELRERTYPTEEEQKDAEDLQKIQNVKHGLEIFASDKPVSSFKKKVARRRLQSAGFSDEQIEALEKDSTLAKKTRQDYLEENAQREKELIQKTQENERKLAEREEKAQQNVMTYLQQNSDGRSYGRKIYRAFSHALGGDEQASRWLNQNGVKGIAYDGGRDGRCYVVFDDNAVSIIEKYNQMAGTNARTAGIMALQKAQAMQNAGRNAQEIWKETGWLQGRDGRWRFEIPDHLDKIDLSILQDGKMHTVSEIYENPELFQAYPALRDIRVQMDDSGTLEARDAAASAGYDFAEGAQKILFNPKDFRADDKQAKMTLVHEIQHVIQSIEGFAKGGNANTRALIEPQMQRKIFELGQEINGIDGGRRYVNAKEEVSRQMLFGDMKSDVYKKAEQEYQEASAALGKEDRAHLDELAGRIQKLQRQTGLSDTEFYRHLAGEQEARMTAERAENPTNELPVPHTNDAIIMYGGDVVDSLQNQDIKGSISQMSNGQRIISLFEHADESTFLHEMSHMFLLDLEDLAKIDDISAKELQIVQDWASWKKGDAKSYKDSPWAREFAQREQAIIDAEEHGDAEEADRQKRQWMQEKFARAFELYLRDGKAPAKGLKAVFRKFRSFLIHIYRAIIGDEVKASVPVQRVMDRMIATEDEIEEAALDDRYRDVTKAGGEKLLNESEEETYKRWNEEALAEAKENLMKRVMKDLTEKKEKEFQDRMTREENEFRQSLQNENVYLAERAVLESGGNQDIVLTWYPSIEAFEKELKNTPPLEDVLAEHMEAYRKELDQQLIDSYLSPSAVSTAMESSEYRAKLEALKATAFAKKQALVNRVTTKTQRAMQSVEEKLTALPEEVDLKLEKDNKAVKALMKEINKLRFSAKWTPKDYAIIERMINAATKEDLQNAMSDIKKQMHEDKANEQAVMKANEGKMQIYRRLAGRAILTKPLHEACSVAIYEREAKHWAKVVQQSIRGKRWDAAMMAQQHQAMSMAMANEAKKMQQRAQKSLDKVKQQLRAKTVHLPAEERYWHRHLAYLLRMTQTDAKAPDGVPDLQTMFRRLQESLDNTYTPTEIFNVVNAGEDFHGYRDLNIGQLEECAEALTILYTTGRDKFKMKTIGGRQIGDIVQEIVSESDTEANHIGVNRKRVEKDTGGMGWNDAIAKLPLFGEGLARYGQQGLAALIKPEEVLSALGKKAHDYIYGIYEKAAEKESRMVQDEMVSLKKILTPYSHAEKLAWKDAKYELWTADGKERLTKENIICMALNFGNEVNRQRLVGGLGMEERDVRSFLEKNMTAKDWQLVQDIWDHIDSYWDDTVKVEESLNGVILEKVQALPFTVVTKDANGKEVKMKLKGGYYPIAYDPEKSSRAADQSANEVARQSMSGAMVLGTNRGFVKARSEHDIQDRPLLLKFQVIPDHVQSVIHNIAFRLAARDVFRLVNHPAFVDYVSRSLGREYHTILKQWTTDVWQVVKDNNNQAGSMVERGINWLRGNSTMAIMGYRLWPVIENISNIAPVMDQLGALHGLKAVVSFYGNLSESWKMLQRSVFMRDRINSLDRDIRQQPGLFAADHRAFEIIRNHAYDMMLWSDLALSAPLWVQTYKDVYGDKLKEVKEENEAHQQAVLSAQERVTKLKADIIDQSKKVSDINMDLEYRHSDKEEYRSYAKQSPFAVHSDAEMHDMAKSEGAKIKEIEKELFQARQDFQDASELTVYTDEEILRETERRSVMAADKAIRDTFGSGRTMDQSSLQRNKNALLRLATTFYSFFNTQFNAILAHYRHARFSGEPSFIGRWAPFARSMMYRLILMSLIGISIKFALGVDGNDDKDKYRTVINPETGKSEKVEIPWGQRFFNTYANNLLSTAAGGFPFFRDVVNMALAYFFDGTTYGRSVSPFSVGGRAFDEGWKAVTMLAGMSEKNMAMDEKEEARKKREADELKKKKGKARIEYQKKLEEDEKYRQPVKHITYSEVARHAANSLSSLTAARTGITSTIVDAITGTMQYLNDTDGRYDKTWNSMVWSALFDKKPVEREIPKRPPKEPAKKKTKKKKKN